MSKNTYIITTYEIEGMLDVVDGKIVVSCEQDGELVNVDIETVLNSIVGQNIYLKSVEELD